jgi:pimeloyl-ACP methyl ester carboxylesterase
VPVVHHLSVEVDAVETFYREAGPSDAPTVLLPHGYPCSSYEFRELMLRLSDRYRLLAPDFPGWGYSATPDDFVHDFDGYARFLGRFADSMSANRFALYLHDFGSQIGLRLAIAAPERIRALIIQNGDIYEDQLGPNYEELKAYWDDPTSERKAKLAQAISEAGYREEFLNGSDAVADRISPDLWALHWALTSPARKQIYLDVIAGLRENRLWFPRYQAYLREHQPPTLIVWGPNDGFMPKGAAQAYLRDLRAAELHFMEDGGHWLLETHLDEVALLIGDFLDRNLRSGRDAGE